MASSAPASEPLWQRDSVLMGLWALTLALAWGVLGAHFEQYFIGLDPDGIRTGSALAVAPVILLTAILTGLRVRRWLRERQARELEGAEREAALGRRQFMVNGLSGTAALVGAAAAGGVGFGTALVRWRGPIQGIVRNEVEETAPDQRAAWRTARVRAYRRLGRTGAEVSDISLGTGAIRGEDGEQIARDAIERGVTYFDTSPDYSGAGSEEAMGRAIKGQRDRMFIATKFCTPQGHLPAGSPVSAYIAAVEGSLRRLQTDHVDLVHIHSCDELDRLLDPGAHEAFDRLREQGKARFLGVSTHTPRLETIARAAIESDRFDVMMLAYHHGIWGALDDVIAEAAARDIGIVAMKTLKGARHRNLTDFRDDATSYAQAAFKWVLSNPNVGCLVISFYKPEHVDEYLYASGASLRPTDVAVLERYDTRIAGTYCPPHCGACLDACPEQVAINDVLRHRMYFENYGWEREGMRLYAQLPRDARSCATCPAPCEASCPLHIPIRERMLGADALLRLA